MTGVVPETVPTETTQQTSTEQVAQTTPQEKGQEQQPQYVTKADLDTFAKQIVGQIKQSDKDRGKRIEGELASIKELVSKTGVQLNPQQEQALREELGERIDSETSPETTSQAQLPTQQVASNDPVADFAKSIFEEVGTTVTPNDPEWAKIKEALDKNFNDPTPAALARVTAAFTVAAQTKAARVSTNQETAAARVGGGGAVVNDGNLDPNAPASSFWKEAYKTN